MGPIARNRPFATAGWRRAIAGLIFVAGLLVGWLGIGWGIWPAQQSNSTPWLMQPAYQQRYISLVAAEYARSGDADQARQALDGWDGESLAILLDRMRAQATTFEERRRLANLAEALELPLGADSLWAELFNQNFLTWGAILAALPLTGALVLALFSLTRRGELYSASQPGPALAELDMELAEILTAEAPVAQAAEQAPVAMDNRPVDDVLADIFGKREQMLAFYESLCADLEEISVSDLARKSARVLKQIRSSDGVIERPAS